MSLFSAVVTLVEKLCENSFHPAPQRYEVASCRQQRVRPDR